MQRSIAPGKEGGLHVAKARPNGTRGSHDLAVFRHGAQLHDGLCDGHRADVALINSGAMRLDDLIGPGPVTSHLLESVFAFNVGSAKFYRQDRALGVKVYTEEGT